MKPFLWVARVTSGSPCGRGWGWPGCTEWIPPGPGGSHSRHTSGSPRANTCPAPAAWSGRGSSHCSRRSLSTSLWTGGTRETHLVETDGVRWWHVESSKHNIIIKVHVSFGKLVVIMNHSHFCDIYFVYVTFLRYITVYNTVVLECIILTCVFEFSVPSV